MHLGQIKVLYISLTGYDVQTLLHLKTGLVLPFHQFLGYLYITKLTGM